MGCVNDKPTAVNIHPTEGNVNNNSKGNKNLLAQEDILKTDSNDKVPEKDVPVSVKSALGQQSTAGSVLGSGESVPNTPIPGEIVLSPHVTEEIIPSQKMTATKHEMTPESGPCILPVLEKTASGHIVPQSVPNAQLEDGFMSVHELYNSMNDGQRMPYLHDPTYMLILDARAREDFNDLHLTTARHSGAVDAEYDCLLEKGRLTNFTFVVVYDGSSKAGAVDPTLASFIRRLKDANIDPQVLSGGFEQFHRTYPFLCNNLTIRSENDRMRLFKSYPSVVLEGALYQGNVKHSADETTLQDLKITHVLNVSMECKNAFPKLFEYLQVKVEDESSAQIEPRLRGAVEFIASALEGGGRVFVHCVQGKSRSSTCTIGFLMSCRGWTLKDAHEYLKDRRSIAAPNRGFLLQLSNFEEKVFGKKLSSVDDLYF